MLLPILLGRDVSNLDNNIITASLKSLEFKVSAACLLTSTLPSFIDLVMDLLFDSGKVLKCASPSIFAHLSVVLTSLLVGIQLCLLPNYTCIFGIFPNKNATYLFATWCLRTELSSKFLFSLTSAQPDIVPPIVSNLLTIFLLFVANVLFHTAGYVSYLAIFCRYSVPVIGCILTFYLLYRCFGHQLWSVNDYSAILYLVGFVIVTNSNVFVIMLLNRNTNNSSQATPSEISIRLYLFIFCITLLTVIPSRIARLNADVLKVFSKTCVFFSLLLIIFAFY
jgi:hypothetical protein